jgi:5,5'-dehydrodivanillate O-demethylase
MQFRVPMDETHTYHVAYLTRLPRDGEVPTPGDAVPVREADVFDAQKNRFKVATNKDLAQDVMAWVTAGEIMDRSQENLGASDRGVVLFHRLLQDQLRVVEEGGDPMNVFRDAAEAQYVHIQTEEDKYTAEVGNSGQRVRFGAFGIFEDIHKGRGRDEPMGK